MQQNISSIKLTNTINGLVLNQYKGAINRLSEFNILKDVKKTETISAITLPIEIPKDCIYTFFTLSNDDKHGMQEKVRRSCSKKRISYSVPNFEGGGGKGLKAKIQGLSLEKGAVSANLLFH